MFVLILLGLPGFYLDCLDSVLLRLIVCNIRIFRLLVYGLYFSIQANQANQAKTQVAGIRKLHEKYF